MWVGWHREQILVEETSEKQRQVDGVRWQLVVVSCGRISVVLHFVAEAVCLPDVAQSVIEPVAPPLVEVRARVVAVDERRVIGVIQFGRDSLPSLPFVLHDLPIKQSFGAPIEDCPYLALDLRAVCGIGVGEHP